MAFLVLAVVQINASGHYLQHPLVAAPNAYPFSPTFAHGLPAYAPAPVFAAPAPAFTAPVPAFAHALPALAPAVPAVPALVQAAAPAVVGLKHSIPYAVPPFASQINIFKKYLTPVVPAPIIAAPHFAHAPVVPAPIIASPHFTPAPILGAPIFSPHLAPHALPVAFGK